MSLLNRSTYSVDFVPTGTTHEYSLDYSFEVGGITYTGHDYDAGKEA